MTKLNFLQYNLLPNFMVDDRFSLESLKVNEELEILQNEFKKRFGFEYFQTLSFTKEGFCTFMLGLDGKIVVSLGECEAIVEGAKLAQKYGKEIRWIGLSSSGEIEYEKIDKGIDFIFVSSYVIDTFVKTDLNRVKSLTNAQIISNISANFDKTCDIALLDSYKLSGFGTGGVILSNSKNTQNIGSIDFLGAKLCFEGICKQKFNKTSKPIFLKYFKEVFGDDLFLFVSADLTLDYSLHIGLKGIKAREIIRSLALDEVFVSNGEGCSLGLSLPSRIIQSMGYSEPLSRWALVLNFDKDYSEKECEAIVRLIHRKYRQIKALQ
jgi:cysteine desulfurase